MLRFIASTLAALFVLMAAPNAFADKYGDYAKAIAKEVGSAGRTFINMRQLAVRAPEHNVSFVISTLIHVTQKDTFVGLRVDIQTARGVLVLWDDNQSGEISKFFPPENKKLDMQMVYIEALECIHQKLVLKTSCTLERKQQI